jgi:hypothetical protein
MRRPRLASCVYLVIALCVCVSIGAGPPAGANVSRDPAADTVADDVGAARIAPLLVEAPPAFDDLVEAFPGYEEVGIASWYGGRHQGRLTASGEVFDENQLTAAHRTLPLETTARVTNLENGRSVEVKVNDRGPYVSGRVIDLSARAAQELGMVQAGLAVVRIEVLPEETLTSTLN